MVLDSTTCRVLHHMVQIVMSAVKSMTKALQPIAVAAVCKAGTIDHTEHEQHMTLTL